VVRYAVSELEAGRTPSPDVLCNQQIKFGAFLDEIDSDFDRVASGHYARRDDAGGSVVLKRGVDPVKDQTYFLSRLSQRQLARALFPIGGIHKSDVRKRARELGLSNQDRRDSQGICFLGKIPYREFVRHHLGEREGDIVDVESGRVLGRHKGYWFHTIGQREGLGLSHGPWFVQGKDVARNVITVCHGDRLDQRSRQSFEVEALHWIGDPPAHQELLVRVRHGRTLHAATLDLEGGRGRVQLLGDDPGIAPGQFAVFYDGEICLGSASIAA
jgi:tRNA-specific 2-thiouridylase